MIVPGSVPSISTSTTLTIRMSPTDPARSARAFCRVRPSRSGVGMRPSSATSTATVVVGVAGVGRTLRVGMMLANSSTARPRWAASITSFQIIAG